MKSKIFTILCITFFLICMGVLDYPFVARIMNERQGTAVILANDESINQMSELEKKRYLEAAHIYNKNLADGLTPGLKDPFGGNGAGDVAYQSVLNMHEDGVIGAIEIPKIETKLPIYHGTSDEVLGKGAGHIEGSSFPIGGGSTHACIAAHRGLPSKRLFTDLDQIEEEDIFLIHVLGDIYAYQVYEVQIVTPEKIEPLEVKTGMDLVTLVTCTPYGVNTHRIYVHGKRVPYEQAREILENETEKRFLQKYWWILLNILLLVWMFVLIYWLNRPTKGEEKRCRK